MPAGLCVDLCTHCATWASLVPGRTVPLSRAFGDIRAFSQWDLAGTGCACTPPTY